MRRDAMVNLHWWTLLRANSAGAVAAETLRHGDFGGTVVLVGEEPVGLHGHSPLPEGHPTGEVDLDSAAVHAAPLSRDQHVSLSTSTTVRATDLVTDTISAFPGVDLSVDQPPRATRVAPGTIPVPGATLPQNARLSSLATRGPREPAAHHPVWNGSQSDGLPDEHVTEALP
jgi:NADPH-dependent 2,4-dienoyl-CoA reductase/sulfur reductase-like enzyme